MFNMYNPQAASERIDNQINQLQQMKAQLPPMTQPTNLTQNFQLTPPGHSTIRYTNSIDDVNKELVIGETPFFSKDMSVLWIKNIKGEVKAYSLAEIVQKDEKDLMIESLQMQIDELKKGMSIDAKSINDDADESAEGEESSDVSNARKSKTKSR